MLATAAATAIDVASSYAGNGVISLCEGSATSVLDAPRGTLTHRAAILTFAIAVNDLPTLSSAYLPLRLKLNLDLGLISAIAS